MKPSTSTVPSICPADALYGLTRDQGRVFVLVDRFSHNPLQDQVDALPSSERPQWFPLVDEIFTEAPQRSPALLELEHGFASHMQLLDMSLELSREESSRPGQPRTVCAWVYTVANAAQLTRGMSRALDVRAGAIRIYLRYFDPRVMPRLVQVLGEVTQTLIAPAYTWCQFGRQGEWMRFDAEQPSSFTRTPRLNRRQSEAIERIEAINKVAAQLASQGLYLCHERDEEVDVALRAAELAGLTKADDQQVYALHCVRDGDSFSRNPKLPEWIQICRQAGLPFDAAIVAAGQGVLID